MIWDLAITMMTEKAFWDTFQKKHSSKNYDKKKKNKFKSKHKKQHSLSKSKSRVD